MFSIRIYFTNEMFKQYSQEQLQNFEVCDDIDECLNRLEFDDKLAVATSRYHIEAMQQQQNIFCFEPSQNIYNYLNTFMIRNDFPMKREFDEILKRIITSGLLSKWQKDMRHYRASIELNTQWKILNFGELTYAFTMFVGLIAALMALIAEIYIYKKANSVNATNYWKFWDKIICGKRYYFLLESRNDNVIIPFTK